MIVKKRHKLTTPLLLLCLSLVTSFLSPELAFAAAPFAGGGAALSGDLLTIIAPIAGIAVMGCGAMCWFGKISWWWFVGLIIGIVLVFGNQQIVTWIRGLFGV